MVPSISIRGRRFPSPLFPRYPFGQDQYGGKEADDVEGIKFDGGEEDGEQEQVNGHRAEVTSDHNEGESGEGAQGKKALGDGPRHAQQVHLPLHSLPQEKVVDQANATAISHKEPPNESNHYVHKRNLSGLVVWLKDVSMQ